MGQCAGTPVENPTPEQKDSTSRREKQYSDDDFYNKGKIVTDN
jgi:hypothetical protein